MAGLKLKTGNRATDGRDLAVEFRLEVLFRGGADVTQLPANYRPISPMLYLERSAYVFRKKDAVVYGTMRRSYPEFAARCYRLASALKKAGVGADDCVAFLCPNIPPMLEAHYGVPLTGAMLCTINIRLAAREIEYIINHCGAKAVFVDTEFAHLIEAIRPNLAGVKLYVNIVDGELAELPGKRLDGASDYEEFIAGGSPDPIAIPIEDENHPISINYTRGTTGNPKGVQYTH
ncbi:AMP-binding protein, partial [Candidatus Sumerlaeota bacterium]|nr:AMP-binding protein [Candidatus Sumerlaeota bacterium]